MKRNIYMVMDKYSAEGWNLVMVDSTDEWRNEHYQKSDTAITLETDLIIRDPDISELVCAGLAKVEELQKQMKEDYMQAKVAAKEYEARFTMLMAPEDIL